MKYFLVVGFLICLIGIGKTKQKTVPPADNRKDSTSVKIYKDFPSVYVDARNIEVWLPPDYDTLPGHPFKVLYMHDGQNVFNAETAYGHVEWGIDEIMDSLIKVGKIKSTVVVAVWNNGKKRFNEYMPKAPVSMTESDATKESLKQNTGFGALYSDDYLKFLVEELKPFIDSNYNVSQKPEDTVIMGSSMGGLISLYAICKYPDIFGKAGCISTH